MVSAILLFATAYVIGAVTGPRLVAWGRRQVEAHMFTLWLLSFPLGFLALVAVAGGLLVLGWAAGVAVVLLAWAGLCAAFLGLSAGLAVGVDAALQTEAGRQLPQVWRETMPARRRAGGQAACT